MQTAQTKRAAVSMVASPRGCAVFGVPAHALQSRGAAPRSPRSERAFQPSTPHRVQARNSCRYGCVPSGPSILRTLDSVVRRSFSHCGSYSSSSPPSSALRACLAATGSLVVLAICSSVRSRSSMCCLHWTSRTLIGVDLGYDIATPPPPQPAARNSVAPAGLLYHLPQSNRSKVLSPTLLVGLCAAIAGECLIGTSLGCPACSGSA